MFSAPASFFLRVSMTISGIQSGRMSGVQAGRSYAGEHEAYNFGADWAGVWSMAEGKPVASHVPSYECLTLKGSTSKPTIRAKSVSRSLWYRMVNRRWLLRTDLPSSCEQIATAFG